MIKSILIFVLIMISLSLEVVPQFNKISKQENKERLQKCGGQRDIGKGEKAEGIDAMPFLTGELLWVVRLWQGRQGKETETNGVLISPRHVLTGYNALKNYEEFSEGACVEE